MLIQKIGDQKFLRYIFRMFKAGVLANGELTMSDEGVPQGSVCSPALANIFAHYVIDKWLEDEVKAKCTVRIKMFRYADDVVIVCHSSKDAEYIKEALNSRLAEYKLKLNKDKTKIVKFARREASRGRQQEGFYFLGFTCYWGRSKKGAVIPKLKTDGKRFRSELKKVKEWAWKACKEQKFKDVWECCCLKLKGHIQYYGVSHNMKAVTTFCVHIF